MMRRSLLDQCARSNSMMRRGLLNHLKPLRRQLHSTSSPSPSISSVRSRPSSYSTRPSPLNHKPTSLAYRPYSTAQETPNSASEGSASEPPKTEAAPEQDPLQKELESKEREIVDLKDKYLRSVADFRNLQDRTKRDVDSARSFAISRFARDLIDSVDNLDRALSTVDPATLSSARDATSSEKSLKDLYQGLKMTESILMKTLKLHGLERFDPSEKGDRFDPNVHDAAFMTRVEGKEDGSVFSTIQKGFMLNGRVIRAAKVGVVKNS